MSRVQKVEVVGSNRARAVIGGEEKGRGVLEEKGVQMRA